MEAELMRRSSSRARGGSGVGHAAAAADDDVDVDEDGVEEVSGRGRLLGSVAAVRDHGLRGLGLEEWKSLFSRKYIDRVGIGIAMMFFQRNVPAIFLVPRVYGFQKQKMELILVFFFAFTEWSGINALLYYGPLLMRRLGLGSESAGLWGSGGIGIVQFLAVLPAILYIDRLGEFYYFVVTMLDLNN